MDLLSVPSALTSLADCSLNEGGAADLKPRTAALAELHTQCKEQKQQPSDDRWNGKRDDLRQRLPQKSEQEDDSCLIQIFHFIHPISATAMSLTLVPVGPVLIRPPTASSAW